MSSQLLQGHVLDVLAALPAESVHCAVTSPPYWGLRSYGTEPQVWGGETEHAHEWGALGPAHHPGQVEQTKWKTAEAAGKGQTADSGQFCACGAWRGELGLEPTPELYVEHMVEVFRAVRRVLRDDGTLWLSLGDTFASGGTGGWRPNSARGSTLQGGKNTQRATNRNGAPIAPGLKPKDLVGIPWRVAFALQADGAADPRAMTVLDRLRAALIESYETRDEWPAPIRHEVERLDREFAQAARGGWWLRSEVIWHKPNPMPESVSDRPTKAHEQVFLLAKSERYFYDAEAIKEPSTYPDDNRKARQRPEDYKGKMGRDGQIRAVINPSGARTYPIRNARSVWTIATQPSPVAHFATFPQELAERCILAGTSERGACAECGAPRARVVERVSTGKSMAVGKSSAKRSAGLATAFSGYDDGSKAPCFKTTGWHPTCSHAAPVVPCVVLDPFSGTGTTGKAAAKLGRDYIGVELLPKYHRIAERRLTVSVEGPLFTEPAP